MKTILYKTRDFFSRAQNKIIDNSPLSSKEAPYVFFRVLPDSGTGEEEKILTGGHLRQSLYKTKPLKSLATALDYVEEAGIQFLKDMVPQNIFLIFGEHPEILYQALFTLPIAPERFENPRISPFPESDQPHDKTDMEYKAVIFCKLKGTARIHDFFGFPEKEPEDNKWTYTLNWLDFFNLKEKQENPSTPFQSA